MHHAFRDADHPSSARPEAILLSIVGSLYQLSVAGKKYHEHLIVTFVSNILQVIASLRLFAVSSKTWIITALVILLSLPLAYLMASRLFLPLPRAIALIALSELVSECNSHPDHRTVPFRLCHRKCLAIHGENVGILLRVLIHSLH